MNCPFCDAQMKNLPNGRYKCPGGGRLLILGSSCPYEKDVLTESEIQSIQVSLIDAEQD